MCPQCGEVGYGIRVGLLSGIVIRPINSGLAPRPGGDDVAHDIRDIIITASVNVYPRTILPPIILRQRERREEEEQASETFHVSQGALTDYQNPIINFSGCLLSNGRFEKSNEDLSRVRAYY
jgi:hypothetical protein